MSSNTHHLELFVLQNMKRFDARKAVLKALQEKGLYRETKENPMVVPMCRQVGTLFCHMTHEMGKRFQNVKSYLSGDDVWSFLLSFVFIGLIIMIFIIDKDTLINHRTVEILDLKIKTNPSIHTYSRSYFMHPSLMFHFSRSKDVIEPLLKPQWYVDCKQMAADSVKVRH